MIYYVDIDHTICNTSTTTWDFENSTPIPENIAKINALYNQGHTIVYWTARGVVWEEITKGQLKAWGCLYHTFRADKPCYDLFIDDKARRIEEICV